MQSALDEIEYVPVKFDPSKADGFPKGWVLSDRAAIDWSDDNKRIFFGAKEQVPAPDTTRRRNADEAADVDVWNSKDERIQSVQMTRADADRNFTYREAFNITDRKFVTLADTTMREVEVSADGRWAVGRDTRGYVSDYKAPAADIYRINPSTGERKLILKDQLIGQHVFGISPDGNYFLYWKDNKFQAYNARRRDDEDARRRSQRQLRRRRVRSSGNEAVVRHHGLHARRQELSSRCTSSICGSCRWTDRRRANLTNGAGDKREIRFRYVAIEPDSNGVGGAGGAPGGGGGRGGRGGSRSTIDLSKPILLSAYGEYTKKAGFYQLADGQLKELVYDDAVVHESAEGGEGRHVSLHATNVHGVPRPARVGPGLQGREKDLRREPAAVRIPVGASHPVRLQGPRRPQAPGHSSRSRTTTSRARSARCS